MKTFEIYQIINTITNEIVYVGSTDRDLPTRYREHLNDPDYPEKSEYLKSHNCDIQHLLYATEESHLTREQTFYRKLKPLFGKKNAKSTHTDAVLKQKEAEAKCKAIIKRGKKPIEKIEEDQYGRSKSIDYTEKKYNNLLDELLKKQSK